MRRFHTNSLISRILILTFTALVLVLVPLGVIIDQAYQNSLKRAVERELSDHAYNLLRAMDESAQSLVLPSYLQEQRLNRPQSSLSAYLVDSREGVIWQSLSSQPLSSAMLLPFLETTSWVVLGDNRFELFSSDGKLTRFSYQYAFEWEFAYGEVKHFLIVVHLEAEEFEEQVLSMRYQLLIASAVLVLVVMLLQVLVFIMGLSPLKRISNQLTEIEQGRRQAIAGEHPIELTRFVTNLNLLLVSLRRQSEQYQNRMADLAHALKTPLTVINNQLNHCENTFDKELNKKIQMIYEVREPLETIDQIVRYQLQRAVTPDGYQWRQRVEVSELTTKIIRSLQKVYQQKSLVVEFDPEDKTYFYGESGDFYELAGNLIDNAFKAAHSCVKIELDAVEEKQIVHNEEAITYSIRLVVEDDGPGIEPDKRQAILNRGIRLDTLKAGQGIGLSVVNDLVYRYRGTLSIEDSQLGGAKFVVTC